MIFIVMPMFTKTWNMIIDPMPTATRLPNRSRDVVATANTLHSNTRNPAITSAEPRNPSCSPTAVKMKSVSCSGTNRRLVRAPSNSPLPVICPDPMAVTLCDCW